MTPKSKRLGRLITASPDMYDLMKDTARYISDIARLHQSCIDGLIAHAERIQELLAQIDGDGDNDD